MPKTAQDKAREKARKEEVGCLWVYFFVYVCVYMCMCDGGLCRGCVCLFVCVYCSGAVEGFIYLISLHSIRHPNSARSRRRRRRMRRPAGSGAAPRCRPRRRLRTMEMRVMMRRRWRLRGARRARVGRARAARGRRARVRVLVCMCLYGVFLHFGVLPLTPLSLSLKSPTDPPTHAQTPTHTQTTADDDAHIPEAVHYEPVSGAMDAFVSHNESKPATGEGGGGKRTKRVLVEKEYVDEKGYLGASVCGLFCLYLVMSMHCTRSCIHTTPHHTSRGERVGGA